MKKVDTLIIGAGISGLSYAINSNSECVIIEKEQTAGGLCRTFHQDGFVWDYAGHFFHFATKELKKFFDKRISSANMVKCFKNTAIAYNESMCIDYPFQMNIHQLDKQEFIDCLYDLFNRKAEGDYTNFEDMLYGKFGKSITEKFLKPYNEKLYACDLNTLDCNAMGRFFPYADPVEIINNMKQNISKTYNSEFEYPKNGAETFIDVLLKELKRKENNTICYNKILQNVDAANHVAIVNDEEITYRCLINTSPLCDFVSNLNYYIDTSSLHANKVLVFNLGFDKKSDNTDSHWLYFPQKECNFYRVGFYDNIIGTDKLSIYVEIGYSKTAYVDIDKQLKETLSNLKKYHIIHDHKLVSWNSVIINPAYVHITNESVKFIDELNKKLASDDIYSIGRYGGWKYCSIEDCMKDAACLARKINEE